jgi:hypothetical protein
MSVLYLNNVRFGSIVLKKSGLVPMAEKYAPEIEILTFSRGCLIRISSSSVQKRCLYPSIFELFGQTNFFNRIGRKQPLDRFREAGSGGPRPLANLSKDKVMFI